MNMTPLNASKPILNENLYSLVSSKERDALLLRSPDDLVELLANPNSFNLTIAAMRHRVDPQTQVWHDSHRRRRQAKLARYPLKPMPYVTKILHGEWREVSGADDPGQRLRRAARNLTRFIDRELDMFDVVDAVEALGIGLSVPFPTIDEAVNIVIDAAIAN